MFETLDQAKNVDCKIIKHTSMRRQKPLKPKEFDQLMKNAFKESDMCVNFGINSFKATFEVIKNDYKLHDLNFMKYKNLVVKLLKD